MAPSARPLTHAPKNPTRRTKEERERLDQRESELRQARADASAADAAAEAARRRAYFGIQRDHAEYRGGQDAPGTFRGGLGGSLRYVRGGRGGFMGQRIAEQRRLSTEKKKKKTALPVQAGAGPPIAAEEAAGPSSSTRRRSARRGGAAQGNLVTGEDGHAKASIKAEPDGDVAMAEQGLQPINKEQQDPAYISSDDEKILGQNIEFINLISDDEDDDNEVQDSSVVDESNRRRVAGLQPLRLIRKPHRDRNMPFNADATSPPGLYPRKEGRDRLRPEDDALLNDESASGTRRGKAKSRTSQVLSERRKWTGAYEDENENNAGTAVKQEGGDEAGSAAAAGYRGDLSTNDLQDQATVRQGEASGTESKEAAAARIRTRRKATQAASRQPAFQTWEEKREYLKRQQDLEDVQYELGHISTKHGKGTGAAATGAKESITAADAAAADKKEDAVYLFQLPPIIPDLVEPSVKQEPPSPELTARAAPATSTLSANPTTSGPIKIEDDANLANGQESAHRPPQFAAGKAGKLRIHKSGRATLTWGGTSMEVSQGINPYFLQSVVLASTKDAPVEDGDSRALSGGPTIAGEATSFGQIRGKLVVTPDWSEILG